MQSTILSLNKQAALAMLLCIAAIPAMGVTTIPTLWTAGGLDAGNSGAGQAARMTRDFQGNVAVVSGPAGRDLAVTSYTPAGVLRWRRTVAPASGTFLADWIVAAPDGDLIAVGRNVSVNGSPIAITMVRYASDGLLRWRVDLARTLPYVGRLVVDGAGDTYLAFNSLGNGQDIQLHKYNAAGVLVWAAVLDSGLLTNDLATSLTVTPDNTEVVLTGSVGGGAIWTTASYDAFTGARKWLQSAAEGVAARDVVTDASRVYVAGHGRTGITDCLTVVAYDRATGARLWRTDRKPADASGASGLRIALAPDGSLLVAGQAQRGFLDWYTVRMETTGAVRWDAVRDGGLNTDEIPAAVLALADGTTVVTGVGGPSLAGGFIQGVTAGYDATGTLQWEAFSRQATVWATALGNGDVCATGGYDALVTCWRLGPVQVPSAPSGLTLRLVSGAIQLTWADNATDETGYSIERSEFTTAGFTNFAVIGTAAANATTYSDAGFASGRENRYRLRAVNGGGYSAYSNTASIQLFSTSPVPTATMVATPSTGAAPLSVAFDGSQSSVVGGTIASWSWTFGDGTTATGPAVTKVYTTPGVYTATLTVVSNFGTMNNTTRQITVTAPAPPSAPTALVATAASRSSIRLNWTNTTTDQTAVLIERCRGTACTAFAQVAVAAGTATTFTNTGLTSRTAYTYRIRSRNAAGNSPYSNAATATTLR